jgi:type I restriction enzyme S subunit
LAINKMKAWQGSVAISEHQGIVSPAYFIYEATHREDSRYLHYLLRSPRYITGYLSISKGIRVNQWDLEPQYHSRMPVVLPPEAEQTAIATFLDRETTKIDGLIAEQEKLIALLAEKRQATISHAVTKGLTPDAPMKDSGVAWLGEVPAHWDVKRVKNVARLESGHTPSKQFPEYWENCDIPWVSLNDSKQLAANDYISDTAVQINPLGLANSSARMLPEGVVVFTRDATIGLAAITTRPMAVSQHLIAWCPSSEIQAIYLLRVFNMMKPFLDSYTFGATIKTIGMGDVKKLVTPVPPLSEQLAIVKFIDRETTRLDALTVEATHGIALLKERRSALISAAVTGKIDVRQGVETAM